MGTITPLAEKIKNNMEIRNMKRIMSSCPLVKGYEEKGL